MKNMVIFIILVTLISCTKQLIVEPKGDNILEKEGTKLESTSSLGETISSKNKYSVIIFDHVKNSKTEYPAPNDKEWKLPINVGDATCYTTGEEMGTKDYFLMELLCNTNSGFDVASVVACGTNEEFDAETLRIQRDGRPYVTLQIQCKH